MTQNPWGNPRPQKPAGGGGRKPESGNPFQEAMEELLRRMGGQNNGGSGKGDSGDLFNKSGLILGGIAAGIAWLSSGIYTVAPNEQAVVLRFGAFHRLADPGLNFHLPAPFESVTNVAVATVNPLAVGARDVEVLSRRGGKSTAPVASPQESLMLTGDENIVDISFEVQWQVSDAVKFLFSVKNPEDTIRAVSDSAMREVVSRTPIADALTEGRLNIETQAKAITQQVLDSYNTGISIVRVQLREVQPPAPVIDAFRDVQNAKADKESEINKAEAYRNDIIPRARGEAEKIIQDAEAYREQVVALAKGEASRFSQIYREYQGAKEVTRTRLYVDAMERVFKDTDKVILDSKAASSGVMPYMALPELTKKQPATKTGN